MRKNLVVLAMSTLPYNKRECRFRWKEGDEKGTPYISQLEPTSLMIKEREGSLDKVLILSTAETLVKNTNYDNKSAVDVYMEKVGLDEEHVEIIGLNEHDFIPAISETVKAIRTYWKENDGNVNLWIDTQGGFRNISLVLTAIITLLEDDGIIPSGFYSVNFTSNDTIKPIEDQTKNYNVFQFVSGINEFSRSGRAEQLIDYYQKMGDEVPEIINIMKDIAWDIQMCDMNAFDRHLENLRNLKMSEESGLLGIFIDQIERDYGKLWSNNWTGLDVAEWFYKKGFYQQAITYIEAKLPKEWIVGTGVDARGKIMEYSFKKGTMKDWKAAMKKEHEKDENVVVTQIGIACFRPINIHDMFSKGIEDVKIYEELKCKQNKNYNLKKISAIVKKTVFKGELSINLVCSDKKKFLRLIGLYKLLKNERNNFNHMSDKEERASKEELGEIIRLFIETGREVYASKK